MSPTIHASDEYKYPTTSEITKVLDQLQTRGRTSYVEGNAISLVQPPVLLWGTVIRTRVTDLGSRRREWSWDVRYTGGEATISRTLIHYSPQSVHEEATAADENGDFIFLPNVDDTVLILDDPHGVVIILGILEKLDTPWTVRDLRSGEIIEMNYYVRFTSPTQGVG